jgi:hypothetical protein
VPLLGIFCKFTNLLFCYVGQPLKPSYMVRKIKIADFNCFARQSTYLLITYCDIYLSKNKEIRLKYTIITKNAAYKIGFSSDM